MSELSAILPDGTPFAFWEDETRYVRELHVAPAHEGTADVGDGTSERPYTSIDAAAQAAGPGDKVRIHAGTYRETVRPRRSGSGNDGMICFEAFGDGEVIVKASVQVSEFSLSEGWNLGRFGDDTKGLEQVRVWTVRLNPEDFKGYNPFCAVNLIHDRVYLEYGKVDMTPFLNRRGMVFVDNQPMHQVQTFHELASRDHAYWVEANGQKVHIRLAGDADPRGHLIELSCREQCFASDEEFISYIHVKGLTLAHASMGAPVPQRGAISCGRGHHWIIEACVIDWSNAVGIDCGDECWQHSRAKGQIHGNSILRRNVIKDAGVCGIAGIRSQNLLIEDNLITGTGWQGMEQAWESGGIKLHHGINALIRRNVIRKCYGCDAIWLDCDHINCRITGNLIADGSRARGLVYLECNRDYENMIDNNIIWNAQGRPVQDMGTLPAGAVDWYRLEDVEAKSGYGIYLEGTDETRIVNNLIGRCNIGGNFARSVAFRLQNGRGGTNRDTRVFHNVFFDCESAALKLLSLHNEVEGNVYSCMPAGYLRVLKPEMMCLDLPTWRKYCGYDLTGAAVPMELELDVDALTMKLTLVEDMPENPADPKVFCDYFSAAAEGPRIAGPFQRLKKGTHVFSVDPRRQS